MVKTCKKCHKEQPASEFYKHPLARDGLFTECKTCQRQRQRLRLSILKNDPKWLSKERARQRANGNLRRILGKQNRKYDPIAVKKWATKNLHKKRCHAAVFRAIRNGVILKAKSCNRCGALTRVEAHHDDYTKPLCIEWLCRQCHKYVHRKPDPLFLTS